MRRGRDIVPRGRGDQDANRWEILPSLPCVRHLDEAQAGGWGGDKGGAALRARGEHFLSLTLRRRGRRFDARA